MTCASLITRAPAPVDPFLRPLVTPSELATPPPHQPMLLSVADAASVPVAAQQPSADVVGLAYRLASVLLEALEGRRALTQLVRWVTDDVWATLAYRAAGRPVPGPLRVRSLRVQQLDDTAAEVAVHVLTNQRSAAVALRLEARANRWVCAGLELGL